MNQTKKTSGWHHFKSDIWWIKSETWLLKYYELSKMDGHFHDFNTSYDQINVFVSKKSPTGPTKEPTPKKPEYLIARSQLTERGPLVRSHSIFDGLNQNTSMILLMEEILHQFIGVCVVFVGTQMFQPLVTCCFSNLFASDFISQASK